MTPAGRWVLGGALISALGFAVLVAWASRSVGLLEGFAAVLQNPWGVVALVDLYMGFLFVALWMALLEDRWWKRGAWIIALFALGNGVTALYLALRLWRFKTLARAVLALHSNRQ